MNIIIEKKCLPAIPDWLAEKLNSLHPPQQKELITPNDTMNNHLTKSEQTVAISLDDRKERARRYLAAMPESISGKAGHNNLLDAARCMVRGFDLPEEDAFQLLELCSKVVYELKK